MTGQAYSPPQKKMDVSGWQRLRTPGQLEVALTQLSKVS